MVLVSRGITIQKKSLIKEEIKDNIEINGSFSLTLDAWIAINQDAYLGITLHFINKNFELKSYLLWIRDLKEPHLGRYLIEELLKSLQDYNIEYNISSITRDNASSNDTLIKELRSYYDISGIVFQGDISCIAHVLNLVVQDILKAIIKEAYNDLDNIDIYNIENEEEVEDIIPNNQKTRWSSIANMLKDLLNLWLAIKLVITSSKSKVFKTNRDILLLKDSDIQYLEKCLKIFNIFIKATTKLQADKYPTIYYLIPEVYNIYTRLENIREELNDPVFRDAINKGIAKLRKYYPKQGINLNNRALYLSLILDPRIKRDGLELIGLTRG
ncbi:uncharacterized protein RAG0_15273 [Rhynchosporium agropyri]|uniref:Uncharacterized protein n=1 Tax=Rhynchosporium agropyri TaxID=914238 RepID=A0A1E1LKD6_9HELO|nr:uncharacterized protein RAG0_15273 [Rhynchosporium agropyri]